MRIRLTMLVRQDWTGARRATVDLARLALASRKDSTEQSGKEASTLYRWAQVRIVHELLDTYASRPDKSYMRSYMRTTMLVHRSLSLSL